MATPAPGRAQTNPKRSGQLGESIAPAAKINPAPFQKLTPLRVFLTTCYKNMKVSGVGCQGKEMLDTVTRHLKPI